MSVRLILRFRGCARGDMDNYEKLILDAITMAGVWGDDSQVKHKETDVFEYEEEDSLMIELSATTKEERHG
jgi:Holliday junction resolvase RusA-like endonuclease